MPETNLDKLKNLLAELFMLDQADLDFGIYRVMNAKRTEVTRFLDNDLLPQVRAELATIQSGDRAGLETEITKAIAAARAAGFSAEQAEQSPKVKELRAQLAATVDVSALENEVLSDLANFFRRYYSGGDFLALRRYKAGVYAISYEGEEVKLHWANADQYYIKTSEFLRDYTFKLADGMRVHFKLVEADTEADNKKSAAGQERRFILCAADPLVETDGDLVIRFEYRPDPDRRKQAELNPLATETILNVPGFAAWKAALARLAPTEKNPNRTLLEKHLGDYTARNSFDYFIHKDIGVFLRRELDFYIKNEIMHLDDIEAEDAPRVGQYLAKIKAIRAIARKIIDFLEQLENFQKKLWLKKKFVVETNYCVTLDRVAEALYPEIAANDAQWQEWEKLFAISEIAPDLFNQKKQNRDAKFLKANPFLVLDTKFFPAEFKEKLLADNKVLGGAATLDEATDGLLIHSDNFQALNFLQKRYNKRVECIYIDPPYNTDASPILYKNDYRDSSWLSMMADRLAIGFSLLTADGVASIAIDDYELANLCMLVNHAFPTYDLQKVVVNHYPGSGTGRSNVSRTHEYNLFVLPGGLDVLRGNERESGVRERNFRRSGTGENNYRIGRENSFFAVLVDPTSLQIKGVEKPPQLDDKDYPRNKTKEGWERIYPFGEDNSERVWSLSYEGSVDALARNELRCTPNLVIIRLYNDEKARNLLQSVWLSTKFNATACGTNLLTDIFGKSGLFSYPKSLFTVATAIDAVTYDYDRATIIDFFGGSGTTGHAVISLNREYPSKKRKYILVEVGEYFNTITKPRIQKVIYSKDWKDGKPVSREGSSHLFKYIRLESYEDALNNLELKRTDSQDDLLRQHAPLREDYLLRYQLDVESAGSASLLNVAAFANPFYYQLKIATGSVGESRAVNVDLVETFNYLLGLRVSHTDTIRGFKVVIGLNPAGEKILVIWRNVAEKSNEELDDFFKKQNYNTKDMEFAGIYVNGDNNLENLKRADETWKVRRIEDEFKRLMFDVQDV